MANRDPSKCIKYIIPIITFAFGILLSHLFKSAQKCTDYQRLKLILLIEAILLLIISFFGSYLSNYLVNCVITLIAAIQVANFDKLDNHPIATTMITGNLKSSMIHLANYIVTKNKECLHSFLKYLLVIISFGIGVLTGSIAISLLSTYSILFCEVMIIIPFILISIEEKESSTST